MKLAGLKVENFRGLKDCSFSFEHLTTIVGANNSGKSSLLLALKLFFSRSKLALDQYYDADIPIRIHARFDEVDAADLDRIVDQEHRTRIAELVKEGEISFVLQYSSGQKAEFLCRKRAPLDVRFGDAQISAALSGTRSGAVAVSMQRLLPEYAHLFAGVTTQTAAKEVVSGIAAAMPLEETHEIDAPLSVGIPASLTTFLPEPILIPAVKDVRDELKTTEASTFGKLVAVLLGLIENTDQIRTVAASLDQLHGLLNVIRSEDGLPLDGRLIEVKNIETTLGNYLRESFPGIELQLEVPKPELKTIFSSAKITLDDGVNGDVESKGDGLKRSLIFALLRTYVTLSTSGGSPDQLTSGVQPYLFLFEEPELYLYPSAQKILFEALATLSSKNQVAITTHSPIFLSPTGTGAFIKLYKPKGLSVDGLITKPHTRVITINLIGEVSQKDAFQLICYENNAAGFFADKVVLVEGDADIIFFDHSFRKLINTKSPESIGLVFIRIQGKGNLRRYKDFFERFGVEVHSILDRDFVIDGIEGINPPGDVNELRSLFLLDLDSVIRDDGLVADPNGAQIKEMIRGYSFKRRYVRMKELVRRIRSGSSLLLPELDELELLFEAETVQLRRAVLDDMASPPASFSTLVERLRDLRVHVLTKGAVEAYYPNGAIGSDKPSKALSACTLLSGRGEFSAVHGESAPCEIERIVSCIAS